MSKKTFASVVAGDRADGNSSGPSRDLPARPGIIPFKDRAANCTIPELALKDRPKVTKEEIWDAISQDFSPLENFFCQIQYLSSNRFRVWCTSPETLEEVIATGITFRGHPVPVHPFMDKNWVTITHLPYGSTEEDIISFLSAYGTVDKVVFVEFRKIRTGTVKVLMKLTSNVPTRVRIAGHAGLAYHHGQLRTCYNCGNVGHEARKCPKNKPAETSAPSAAASTSANSKSASTSKTPSSKRKRSRKQALIPPVEVQQTSGDKEPPAKKASSGGHETSIEPAVEGPESSTSRPDTTEIELPLAGSTEIVKDSEASRNHPPASKPSYPSVTTRDLEYHGGPSLMGDPTTTLGPTNLEPREKADLNFTKFGVTQSQVEALLAVEPHPRLPNNANFRYFNGTFIYIEDGELSSEDEGGPDAYGPKYPSLVRDSLRERGHEIREILLHYDGPVDVGLKDDALAIFDASDDEATEPLRVYDLKHSRSRTFANLNL